MTTATEQIWLASVITVTGMLFLMGAGHTAYFPCGPSVQGMRRAYDTTPAIGTLLIIGSAVWSVADKGRGLDECGQAFTDACPLFYIFAIRKTHQLKETAYRVQPRRKHTASVTERLAKVGGRQIHRLFRLWHDRAHAEKLVGDPVVILHVDHNTGCGKSLTVCLPF